MKKFQFIILLIVATICVLGLQSCGESMSYSIDTIKTADQAETASLNKAWIDSGYVQVDYVVIHKEAANYIVEPDIFSFTLSGKNSSFIEVPQSGNLDSITIYPNNVPMKLGEFAKFANSPGAKYQEIILHMYEIQRDKIKSDESLDYLITVKVWAKK